MIRYASICVMVLLALPAAAQEQPSQPQPIATQPLPAEVVIPESKAEDFDLVRKKVVDCEGEKFVFAWGAGANPTKVTLCSKKNATPEEVIRMLEESAAKIEQTPSIAEDRRIAIVQQIRAKINERRLIATATTAPPPPLPATPPAPPAGAQAPSAVAQSGSTMVAPRPVAAASIPRLAPRPRLSFECITPGEMVGQGPCVTLNRDTVLVVKSGEVLPGGIGLRFVRQGEERAEVTLGAMRKGQTLRLPIPRQVCSGVFTSEVEVGIVRGGREVDSIGPFLLRC